MADTTETQWFKIVVFISAGFFAGLFLANIIYYNRVRTGGTLSHGEALSMLWLNVILFVVAIIIFIWALIRLIIRQDVRQDWTTQAQTYSTKYLQGTEGGFTFGQTKPQPVGLVSTTNVTQVPSGQVYISPTGQATLVQSSTPIVQTVQPVQSAPFGSIPQAPL